MFLSFFFDVFSPAFDLNFEAHIKSVVSGVTMESIFVFVFSNNRLIVKNEE